MKKIESTNGFGPLVISIAVAFGLLFAMLMIAFIGCSETTAAGDPAAADPAMETPAAPSVPAAARAESTMQQEGDANENAGMLEKASDLFGKATASGGRLGKEGVRLGSRSFGRCPRRWQ